MDQRNFYLKKLWKWIVSNHSHKKRTDSLETQAQRAILRAYVENQAMLEPILFYCASKYKQTKRPGY